MQDTVGDERQSAVECPTCGATHTVRVSRDVIGDPVVTTARALTGEFTTETCAEGHAFFVYYC